MPPIQSSRNEIFASSPGSLVYGNTQNVRPITHRRFAGDDSNRGFIHAIRVTRGGAQEEEKRTSQAAGKEHTMKKLIATMLTVALIGCETIPSTQDIASLATATSVPPPTKKMSRSEQEFYNTRVYAASLPPEERRAFAQAYMQEFAARRAAQAQIAAAVIQGAAVANAGFQVSNAINQASLATEQRNTQCCLDAE
jgi:hypothetical protein